MRHLNIAASDGRNQIDHHREGFLTATGTGGDNLLAPQPVLSRTNEPLNVHPTALSGTRF